MQIETFEMFCDLAETKSFKKAALSSGVTRSAVSQQVAVMERQFKARLVERSRKSLRLTPEGELVFDYGKQILSMHEAIQNEIAAIKNVVGGKIHLATIYSIGLHHLPPYLTRFLKAYPTVNVHVEYRHSSQIYNDLKANVVDLGLVAYPHREAGMEIALLHKEPLVLICHPNHSLAKCRSASLKELDGQNFIHFQAEIPTRVAIDKLLKRARVTVKKVMEFDNIETVKKAVEIDAGVAVVPAPTVADEVRDNTLAAVPLKGKDLFRPLAVIYKKGKILSPAMKQFLATLKGEK